jgi:hypothetical protein
MLLAYAGLSVRRRSLAQVLGRYWWVLLAGVAYFGYVAQRYQTSNGNDSVLGAFVTRLTVTAAEPAAIAMRANLPWYWGNSLVWDFDYFSDRYLGKAPGHAFSFENFISGLIYNVDPSGDWVVPVTISGPAELFFNFPAPIVVLLLFMVGAIFARLEGSGRSTVLRVTIAYYCAFALYTWLIRGGLIYHTINYLAVGLALFAVLLVVEALTGRPGGATDKSERYRAFSRN